MWRASHHGVLAMLVSGTNVSRTIAASPSSLAPSLARQACTAAADPAPKESSTTMHTSDHRLVGSSTCPPADTGKARHGGYRIFGPGDIERLHPAC